MGVVGGDDNQRVVDVRDSVSLGNGVGERYGVGERQLRATLVVAVVDFAALEFCQMIIIMNSVTFDVLIVF